MKNLSKIVLLIFMSILTVLIFFLLQKFGVHSQTNRISNISISSNAAVTSRTSELSSGSNSLDADPQTSGGIITGSLAREGICSSGFEEIPVELQQSYAEQRTQTKSEVNSSNEVFPLRNEIKFYAFIYPFNDSSEPKRDETHCTNKSLEPEKIQFASSHVNRAVEKYISAMIYNQSQINIAERKIPETLYIKDKTELCMDIECGTKNPEGKKQLFNAATEADLIYANSYSDSQIYASALNTIRSISQSDKQQHLTDSEITQILSLAGRIAVTKVKEITN